MKKISKFMPLIVIAVTLVIVIVLIFAFGSNSNGNEKDDSYYISSYSAEYKYKEGRTFSVTENISAVFLKPNKHGIVRDLATNSGEVYYNVAVLGTPYSAKFESGGFISLYMGDEDSTILPGSTANYKIVYEIKLPEGGNRDSFAINVLGGGWATDINNFSCTVTLPYAAENYELYGGNAVYEAEGNVCTISATSVEAFQPVTLYANYNGGTLAAFTPDTGEFIALGAAIAVLVVVVLAGILMRGRKPIAVVNFYPPENTDPLMAGTLIDSVAHDDDVTALLYYWASKGLIEIDFSDEKDPLIKLKKGLPEGSPEHQSILFNKIFEGRTEAKISTLSAVLPAAAADAKTIAARNTPAMYTYKSRILSLVVSFVAAAVYVLTLIARCAASTGIFLMVAFVAALAPISIYLTGNVSAANRMKYSSKKHVLLFIAQLAEVACFTVAAYFLVPQTLLTGYINILLMLLCCAIAFASRYLLRFSDWFCDVSGPLLGFRQFLETAEKDRLEKLIDENPEYYYDILPYAQVLGVSDVWESKFAGLDLQPPAWASGYSVNAFNVIAFTALMRSTGQSITTSIAPPSAAGRSGGSGGGFSGGGGFAGGGFGGGGGRSW